MFQRSKLITIVIGTAFLLPLSTTFVIAHECKHCEDVMSEMDADGDGQASRTEFMRQHGRIFDEYDDNNDRFLDNGELHNMLKSVHGDKLGATIPDFVYECKHCEDMMSEMDADGDGQASRVEFMRHHGQIFDKYDDNNNRFLDANELQNMLKKVHGQKHDHDKDNDSDSHDHMHKHND